MIRKIDYPWDRGEADILYRVVRKAFVDNVIFEQKPEGSEGSRYVDIERRTF